jgi:hypothetical protein
MRAVPSPRQPPMRAPWRRVAGMVLTSALLTGCTSDTDAPDGAGPTPTTASSAGPSAVEPDLSRVTVPRTDVCGLLAEEGVERALDGPVADTAHYDNGEPFEVAPGRVDISHEYGCVFEGADATVARTWIFARPVRKAEGRRLVRRARRERGCAFPEPLVLATPGLTSVCEEPGHQSGREPLLRVRVAGLVGDTWLTCEISEPLQAAAATGSATPRPRTDTLRRAGQWCTSVVAMVSGS